MATIDKILNWMNAAATAIVMICIIPGLFMVSFLYAMFRPEVFEASMMRFYPVLSMVHESPDSWWRDTQYFFWISLSTISGSLILMGLLLAAIWWTYSYYKAFKVSVKKIIELEH